MNSPRLMQDERGFVFTIPIILLLCLGGFFLWGMAAINWQAILAVFAAGIIAMAFAGFFFFHADWNYVMIASIIALAIVFIVEISFPVLVGGLLVLGVVWNFKMLAKQPLIMMGLIILGIVVMMFTYKACILGGMIP